MKSRKTIRTFFPISGTSFFNSCLKKIFILTCNKCGNHDQIKTWSLVFVLMLISILIHQNFEESVEEGCSASLCIAHEEKLEIISI
jgi:hypothetical protein